MAGKKQGEPPDDTDSADTSDSDVTGAIDVTDPRQTGALGGRARAARMTSEELSASGRHAVNTRWSHPRATHLGVLKIGDISIGCAVLENGRRIINDTEFQRALGRSAAGGQTYQRRAAQDGIDQLPIYVALRNLKPFIPEGFSVSTIQYIRRGGGLAVGVDAAVIPAVCSVWLAARRAGKLRASQLPTAERAEIIMNGLATVGIIALVDEATGYQYQRDRDELARQLERFINKKLAAWVKTFPDDFYSNLCKLRGIRCDDQHRPRYFGHLTNDLVYSRLAPGVLDELKRKNPPGETGRRRAKHHQWLTKKIGHPALRDHLLVTCTLMKVAPNYNAFVEQLDHVAPRVNSNLYLLSYDQMQPPTLEEA
ncbi:MAG TPA: P63C domain-containing protein [Kofleriaceae bacterium]|nr:P63C domain-containing protein [Kofleriaceae bacterium]